MTFQTIRDLDAHIDSHIGSLLDLEFARENIVQDIAKIIVRKAREFGLAFGEDWTEPLEEVFSEQNWLETLGAACQPYMESLGL